MKRQARQIVAVVVVATALCADRPPAAAAAPSARTHAGSQARVAQIAGRIVDQLSQNFRRPVRMDLSAQPGRGVGLTDVRPANVAPRPVAAAHPPISPFQFRLPPPLA